MMRSTGEIYEKLRSSFEWKIKNFASLSAKTGEYYESPPFDFYNAKWCLVIYPNGRNSSCSDYIAVFLKKLNHRDTNHTVFRKISVKKSDGTDYASYESEKEYGKNIQWGMPTFLDRYQLLEEINDVAPNGILTISCTFFWNRIVSEATLEAGSTEGKDESLEEELDNTKKKGVISNADKRFITTVIDSEKLMRDMATLFLNGQDSDVTVVVQDRKFPVHRAILGIRSPVFAAMFAHDLKEKTTGIVTITDFDPQIFHEFLLYLYTAKVENFSVKTAVGLYSVADKYDTQELKIKCVEFMRDNLSLDMFCSVVSLALQRKESSVLLAATKFFVKNFKQVIISVEWQAFLRENPAAANELLVKASNFYVPPEG